VPHNLFSARELVDSTKYEPVFKKIYENSATEAPTKRFAERTLKGIEGEKRRLRRFKDEE